MKLLVTGDRNWSNKELLEKVLTSVNRLYGISILIHGDAKGADRMAGDWAKANDINVLAVPADWNKHHKAAGPIRNRVMLDMEPDLVVGFHHDIESSKGTKDCLKEAKRRGIETKLTKQDNDLDMATWLC